MAFSLEIVLPDKDYLVLPATLPAERNLSRSVAVCVNTEGEVDG
jgi:hypothetical protein